MTFIQNQLTHFPKKISNFSSLLILTFERKKKSIKTKPNRLTRLGILYFYRLFVKLFIKHV